MLREDGRHYRSWGDATMLGDDRIVFWDRELDRSVIYDVSTGEARELEGVPGPSIFDFSSDGRTVAINYSATASDIWLLTLAD